MEKLETDLGFPAGARGVTLGARGVAAGTVRVWLLGGFSVSVGGRLLNRSAWRLRKAASLVQLLALAPRHRLHKERVVDLLWPDLDAKRAANNLHRVLHVARGLIDPASSGGTSRHLTLRNGLIALNPDDQLWVDVEAFEGAAAMARRGRDPAAYRAAVTLYAGDLLPGDLYEPWAEDRREALRRLCLTLLTEMAALLTEREEYGPAIEALERVAIEDPTDEAACAGLMRLYAAEGRRLEALLRYERFSRTVAEKLGSRPTAASRRLYETIRAGGSPEIPHPPRPGAHPDGVPSNLPSPLSSFVGRRREMVEVNRSLSMTRLLTLTGMGGSGKTRLALEVARELLGAHPGGTWLAELAPLSDPALVPRAVASALGVREHPDRPLTRTISERIGSAEVLLVLDNCEHLVDAAARLVKELTSDCPRLRVLATSREPLGVSGESVWPVSTLSLPEAEGPVAVEALMVSEAVHLFVDRARSRLPDFRLTPENAGAVATVCRKLDGIPLAIELSTARMAALAVEQVAQRLDDSLGLLTGGARTADPRQQTMRATLEWSHDLLGGPERVLFRRLSVFAGGFSLEAAGAVGAGGGIGAEDVLDLLYRLVDKSVVLAEGGNGGGKLRYRMLEPVRQYAWELLRSGDEAGDVRRRHALWYIALAREVEPWLRGGRREVWLERLETEYANLRTALDWALETGETELGLWFGAALGESWYMGGNLSEGRRWLEAALAKSDDASPARAGALARACWIAWEQGDYRRSVILGEESLALSRGLGDEAGVVAALTSLGWAALLEMNLKRASALAGEAEALARALADPGGVARALLIPGLTAVARRDHARAAELHEESLALAREAGDDVAVTLSLVMGVFARLGRGDAERAARLCDESRASLPQPGVTNVTAFQLSASAALAEAQELSSRAARLWGAAESLRETIGAVLSPVERHVYGPYLESARTRLGGAAWERAWAEGRAMPAEVAVEYASKRDDEVPPVRTPHPAPGGPPANARSHGPLTRRQHEVALLVARGLTNRRIAEALSISDHTAANHVAAIIRRLGVESRTGIAARVTAMRLQDAP